MSGGLAPSKSTVYVSNLPFSLTNNDLHKVFEKYGQVAKVTILRDRRTRQSKGVAFVLFKERDSAHKCCHAVNKTQMFGRTIACSIAKDNGRAQEFIKRKIYKDKSRCYECGEEGHLSYRCPNNLLGEREPPPKKEKRKHKDKYDDDDDDEEDEDEDEDGENPAEDSLAAAIRYQAEKESTFALGSTSFSSTVTDEPRRKKYKKDAYFSDEEDFGDDD